MSSNEKMLLDNTKSYHQQVQMENEVSLLRSYTESLHNVLEIEKELIALRKKSASKISVLNNECTDLVSFYKKTENYSNAENRNSHIDLSNKVPYSDCANGVKYIEDELSKSAGNYVKTPRSPCIERKFDSAHRYNLKGDQDRSDLMRANSIIINDSDDDLHGVEDTPFNFARRLNNLYTHLIDQYVRDEKLLSKYFEIMQNVREKSALNMAKNELLKLKTKRSNSDTSAVDHSSSLKKRQRALLMKLQHEYNEIKFMRNFQKKLSDDRKKILFRQLRHFRTMFSYGAERKTSVRLYPRSGSRPTPDRKSPLKCYNGAVLRRYGDEFDTIQHDIQECYAFLNSHKEKLNSLLNLHMDLRLNAEGIDSIDENKIETLFDLQRLEYARQAATTNQKSFHSPKDSDKSIVNSICSSNEIKVPDDGELVVSSPIRDYPSDSLEIVKQNNPIELDSPEIVANLNGALLFIANVPTRIFHTWRDNLDAYFRATDALLVHPNRDSARILFEYFDRRNIHGDAVSIRMSVRNIFERLMLFCDSIWTDGLIVIGGREKIACLLYTVVDLLFATKKHRGIRGSVNSTKSIELRLAELSDDLNDSFFKETIQLKLLKLMRRCRVAVPNDILMCIEQSSSVRHASGINDESVKSIGAIDKCHEGGSVCDSTLNGCDSNSSKESKTQQADEAEELRRKQLAVELEIKALLEQQTTTMPYFLVREIPDKPPPPYIPPADDAKISTATSTENVRSDGSTSPPAFGDDRIRDTVKFCHDNIWSAYLSSDHGASDREAGVIFKNKCAFFGRHQTDNAFLYDLCNELFLAEYEEVGRGKNAWDHVDGSACIRRNRDVCATVECLVGKHLSGDASSCRDSIFINCAHKLQDHVDELLIKELQDEEPEWVNVERYEANIKQSITDHILNTLITDTVDELKNIYENK